MKLKVQLSTELDLNYICTVFTGYKFWSKFAKIIGKMSYDSETIIFYFSYLFCERREIKTN